MLFDTHSHLNLKDFQKDYKEAAERALNKNIYFINVGVDLKTSERAVEIAEELKNGVFASVGMHPSDAPNATFDKQNFLGLAKNEKVVAIGECGLDYYRSAQKNRQRELLLRHIELAAEVGKPLIIHCREAHQDLLQILENNKSKLKPGAAGVMHFFGGEGAWENADEYLNLGFYISFSGVITFPKYSRDADIKRLPLDRILIETDSPFAAPAPHRGKRNEPSYLPEISRKLAEIRAVSFQAICEQTTENARDLFSLREE